MQVSEHLHSHISHRAQGGTISLHSTMHPPWYRHYFSHHLNFFDLLWPQIYFIRTSYVGCLYVTLASLSTFFCDFIALDAQPRAHTRTQPDWCLKPLLFTPVRMQLIYHQYYTFSAGRFIKGVCSNQMVYLGLLYQLCMLCRTKGSPCSQLFDCGCGS